MKWINVQDKLPKIEKEYLTYIHIDGEDFYILLVFSGGKWYDEDNDSIEGVTHWMPLQPPNDVMMKETNNA